MTKLTIYVSPSCDACKAWLPTIRKNAAKRGENVTVRDIAKCVSDECKGLEAVPSIIRNGKLLSDTEMKPYYER